MPCKTASEANDDRVFELDIEDVGVLATVMRECGADGAGFAAFAAGDGRRQLLDIQREAEAAGVFGVTSFLLDDGDLYWGREHLPRIKALLLAG